MTDFSGAAFLKGAVDRYIAQSPHRGYQRGDNRKLVHDEARQHGWTVSGDEDLETYERRESNIVVRWTSRDTMTYASINIQGTSGRIPAKPRMAIVQTRQWLSAPGESTSNEESR